MSDKSQLIVHSQNSPLQGSISVPGDKSISHRAVLLAALAEGASFIRNWLPAGDTLATLEVVRALGVSVEVNERGPQAWDLRIEGRGLRGLRAGWQRATTQTADGPRHGAAATDGRRHQV
jgi:3-phosphoshikimate 1-carboxyvinyltransferase